MQAINREAKEVMTKIVGMLVDGYLKLDNAPGSFMPLVVERIVDLPGFDAMYSLAHYGELNGDLMADPEMTFGERNGEFYPLSFRNDYLGYYREVITYREGQEAIANERLQQELAEFTAQWLRNVVIQQGL